MLCAGADGSSVGVKQSGIDPLYVLLWPLSAIMPGHIPPAPRPPLELIWNTQQSGRIVGSHLAASAAEGWATSGSLLQGKPPAQNH